MSTGGSTSYQPKPGDGTKALIILGVAVAIIAFLAFLGTQGPDGGGSGGGGSGGGSRESPFSDESCRAQAAQLRRDHPDVYYSDEEAYQGCRDAEQLVDDLRREAND